MQVPRFSVLEVVEYTDTLNRDRSFTRLVREDGYPFSLMDSGKIYPEFSVTEADKEGINQAIRAFFHKAEKTQILI